MTQASHIIVDEIELQERREMFDNWEYKRMSHKSKHSYLISMAIDVHTEVSGEHLSNGFKTFSLAGTRQCMDGDCSDTHFDLLWRPTYENANGSLVCFIITKGSKELLIKWGYSEAFQRNLGLIWEF